MAPQLAAAIRELTCRTCLGEGQLATREHWTTPGGRPMRTTTAEHCRRCQGTGISHYEPRLPA